MILSMGPELSLGQMVVPIKDLGLKVNNMAMVSSSRMEESEEGAGKMAKELNGKPEAKALRVPIIHWEPLILEIQDDQIPR